MFNATFCTEITVYSVFCGSVYLYGCQWGFLAVLYGIIVHVCVCDWVYTVILTFIMAPHRDGRQGSNTLCQGTGGSGAEEVDFISD